MDFSYLCLAWFHSMFLHFTLTIFSHFWLIPPGTYKKTSIHAQAKISAASRLLLLILEASKKKYVTWTLERGGGSIGTFPPSTFDTIHPIDMKLSRYNKLHLYFQLSETTWCLIDFHGNNSQINDVTGGRHLGFLNFKLCSDFHFCTSNWWANVI